MHDAPDSNESSSDGQAPDDKRDAPTASSGHSDADTQTERNREDESPS